MSNVEVGTAFLGEGDALVINQSGVLDRSDSGADRILDAFGGVCMSCYAKTKVVRLVYGRMQLLGSELGGLRVAPVRQHGASGENLDVVSSSMSEFANLLPHF